MTATETLDAIDDKVEELVEGFVLQFETDDDVLVALRRIRMYANASISLQRRVMRHARKLEALARAK